MPPIAKFLLRRLVSIPISLLIITVALFGFVMLTPPEVRVQLYWQPSPYLDFERNEELRDKAIEQYGLDDPFPVQYGRWLTHLLRGDWGYSPNLSSGVLEALLARTPATAELTLYSILLFIPLGLLNGVLAGWRQDRAPDNQFRLAAFISTSIPPFILGLILISIFYVGLRWFAPGRMSTMIDLSMRREGFVYYTHLLTIDGLLNRRLDVVADAVRHLVLPVVALSLSHWATLGRVMRASMIEEFDKEYIVAARARGVRNRAIVFRHALRNALVPALTSSILSISSLVTGVFVIERVFNINGLSEILVLAWSSIPDAPAAVGFAVFSALIVLPLMTILEIIQAFIDPRIREGITSS